jgi:hypothetical protein
VVAVDTARGIRELVVGTGGRSLYAMRPDARRAAANGITHGILKLTLFANSHDWQFISESGGTLTDAGTGTCQTKRRGGQKSAPFVAHPSWTRGEVGAIR